MSFIFERLTFNNDIQYPSEWELPPLLYSFIQTDPNVPPIGNKYAFVVNYISGTAPIQTDARIQIFYINRTTERLDYLTTTLLSAAYGKTVDEVAGVFVPEAELVIVDNDVPIVGFGDFNNDFNNDFLIS
jgi:hypothetical protein